MLDFNDWFKIDIIVKSYKFKPDELYQRKTTDGCDLDCYRFRGQLHNPNGPAAITTEASGEVRYHEYRMLGELHNIYGPAYVHFDLNGNAIGKNYYLFGKYIDEAHYNNIVSEPMTSAWLTEVCCILGKVSTELRDVLMQLEFGSEEWNFTYQMSA